MRFMVIVKASEDSEASVLPSEQLLTEMGRFNEELTKAGVLLAAEGLQASSKGARVRFMGAKRQVIHGPFAETKQLVAGFWLGNASRCKRPWNGPSAVPTPCRARRLRSNPPSVRSRGFRCRVYARPTGNRKNGCGLGVEKEIS